MEKSEKQFIKSFLETKYPEDTHNLKLDVCFDYYNALCYQLISNERKLTEEILNIEEELEHKILNYIEENKQNNYGLNMSIYYLMIKIVINILNKYYKKDGTIK